MLFFRSTPVLHTLLAGCATSTSPPILSNTSQFCSRLFPAPTPGLGLTKLGQCMAIPRPLLVTAQDLRRKWTSPWPSPGNHAVRERTHRPSAPDQMKGEDLQSMLRDFLSLFLLNVKKEGSTLPYWHSQSSCKQEGTSYRMKPLQLVEQREGINGQEMKPALSLDGSLDEMLGFLTGKPHWVGPFLLGAQVILIQDHRF